MAEEYIWIITDDTEPVPVEGRRGGWGEDFRQKIIQLKEVKLPVSKLEQKMKEFIPLIGKVFQQVDEQIGLESDFRLNEVELLVEISGEGEIKLVAGGKATGKGAITLKFQRVNSN